MKKRFQKLQLNKSKIAHFQALYIKGGTDIPSTNPYNNITQTQSDCPGAYRTIVSCCPGSCDTLGKLRTNEDSPCGNNTVGLHTDSACNDGNTNLDC